MSGQCPKCGAAGLPWTPICPACGEDFGPRAPARGRLPDPGTTRRIISDFFLTHRSLIMPHVLEVGSARPADAWWADLQAQLGMVGEDWLRVDMQDSECTDLILDLTEHGADWGREDQFGSCVCAEVLEHVTHPNTFLQNVWSMLRPGAWIVITSPFAFPVHGFPDDYWRFTPSGMQLLLKNAGFENYQAFELDVEGVTHFDHIYGPGGDKDWDLPLWIGAIARKPE